MTPHVTNVDYLSRRIDPVTGNLHTERLLSCKQNIPDFFMKIFGGQNSSIVYEKSVVDLEGRKLVLKACNLTLSQILTIEETCTYEAFKTQDLKSDNGNVNVQNKDQDWTKFTQEASIRSFSAWNYLRDSLEDFSISRFQINANKGRLALEHVLQDLYNDTRTLLNEKFGEFEEEIGQFMKYRDDPQVKKEAVNMAEEAIIEQE